MVGGLGSGYIGAWLTLRSSSTCNGYADQQGGKTGSSII